jgi:hypothetical protein
MKERWQNRPSKPEKVCIHVDLRHYRRCEAWVDGLEQMDAIVLVTSTKIFFVNYNLYL